MFSFGSLQKAARLLLSSRVLNADDADWEAVGQPCYPSLFRALDLLGGCPGNRSILVTVMILMPWEGLDSPSACTGQTMRFTGSTEKTAVCSGDWVGHGVLPVDDKRVWLSLGSF